MNTTTASTTANRPSLAFYHANGKGTGCAAKFTLHPATAEADGCFFVRMANQTSLGDRLANPPVYPSFDWDNGIDFKLCFADVCEVLRVLLGETESIQDGKGLYHCLADGRNICIRLRHMVEPISGYSLEVSQHVGQGNDNSARIVLSPTEALGLCLALEYSMGQIVFGVPTVE